YKEGEEINISVELSEIVNVSTVSGLPRLKINLGSEGKFFLYSSGSGTNTLSFSYVVENGDNSNDLEYLSKNALELNGGKIEDQAGNNVDLILPNPGSLASLGYNKNIIIDTIPPALPVASSPSGSYSSPQFIILSSLGSSEIKFSTTQNLTGCSEGLIYLEPINITSSATLFVLACDAVGNTSKARFNYNILDTNLQLLSEKSGQTITASKITLNNLTSLDLSNGVSSAVEGDIVIDGASQSLNNFSSGDLTNKNLDEVQMIGGELLKVEKAVKISADDNIALNNTDLSDVLISIPNNTIVLGSGGWDGKIYPPKNVSGEGIAPSGFSVGDVVIEVGSDLGILLFDQPVVITLNNVTGNVGYKPSGSTSWTEITTQCSGDYDNPGKPDFPGECYISDGTNTKIYTYHFTTFGKLNTVSSSSGDSGSNNSSSTTPNVNTSAVALACGDTKPAVAPILLSANQTGPNEVTLNWSKAQDPVTYYLVAYGLSPGSFEYGNPNVGGADTTLYVIQNLSAGKTYYFKIRAGNGCTPGDYSNEIPVVVSGTTLETIPDGFVEGVLGVESEEQKNDSVDNDILGKNESSKKASVKILEKTSNQTKPLAIGFISLVLLFTFFYWWRNKSSLK
ncbi:fibronectin type III domain-containing protein, partial [Candidatus Parcubacteria bacterium]